MLDVPCLDRKVVHQSTKNPYATTKEGMFGGTHTQQPQYTYAIIFGEILLNNIWAVSVDSWHWFGIAADVHNYFVSLLCGGIVLKGISKYNTMQQPWKLWFDGYIRIYNSWDRFRHSWIYRTNQPTKLLQYYLVLTNPDFLGLKLNCMGMQQHSRLTIISHEKCRRGAEYTALSYPI